MSTARRYVGSSDPAGYDGPGECLRHVLDSPMLRLGTATAAHWSAFDQTEFFDQAVGFQNLGWVYVPNRCQNLNGQGPGSSPCKLVVRPGKCSPPATDFAADVAGYASYAEANGIVVLHPCLGGAVDIKAFPHAPDIVAGRLDVYGQLDLNYVHQSAPHMRVIGAMVARVLNGAGKPTDYHRPSTPVPSRTDTSQLRSQSDLAPTPDFVHVPLPSLGIDKTSVMTAGCSNTADFSHQFHVAFSSIVTGSCIFSGMPYHCAVTRFTNDYMVSKSNSTAAGIHCDGCDDNGTLTYDHCKNHPLNVELDRLWAYAEAPPTGHVIDDPKVHLTGARVFSFGPTHDRYGNTCPPALRSASSHFTSSETTAIRPPRPIVI